jgi:hypothetical protein
MFENELKNFNLKLEDDSFFIILLLMDYPQFKRKEIFFSDFKSLRLKNTSLDILFSVIVFCNKLAMIEICEVKGAENKKILSEMLNNWDVKDVLQYFKNCNQEENKTFFANLDFKIKISEEVREILKEKLKRCINLFKKDQLFDWNKNA